MYLTANQAAEIYAPPTTTVRTRNWGASKISWDQGNWEPKPDSQRMYPYVKSTREKGGSNTMICLIDEGGFNGDDFVSNLADGPNHALYVQIADMIFRLKLVVS